MAQHVAYGFCVWADGKMASCPKLFEEARACGEAVRLVAKGLGLKGGSWCEMAPGVRVCCGPERGGWLLVAYRVWVPDTEPARPKTKAGKQRLAEGRAQAEV